MTIKKRLKSRHGFTLAETMLAVLILALVGVILATGVPVALNAYEKIVLTANAQAFLSTTVNALRDELGTAWGVQTDDTGTVITYYSADTGARSRIYLATDSPAEIMLQENAAISELGIPDNADAARALVSDKATAGLSRLYATYESVAYDRTSSTVTFTNLMIGTKSAPSLTKVGNLKIRVFSDN